MDIFKIMDKRDTLSYEEFVKYCFYELKRFGFHLYLPDSFGEVYSIEPRNDEQWNILKKISIEHFKKQEKNNGMHFTNISTATGENRYLYYSFETLKKWYKQDLQREFAVKEEVIERYKRDYINHCKNTITYTDLISGVDPFLANFVFVGTYADYDLIREVYTFKELIRFDEFLNNELKLKPSQLEEPQPIEEVETENTTHPIYDANLWNKEAFKFFKYLYDNYYLDGKPTNVKLASIWHYLTDIKYDDKINEPTYNLHATKDQYKDFIEKEYRIKITNMDKKDSYNKTHRPIIDNHLKKYEET